MKQLPKPQNPCTLKSDHAYKKIKLSVSDKGCMLAPIKLTHTFASYLQAMYVIMEKAFYKCDAKMEANRRSYKKVS